MALCLLHIISYHTANFCRGVLFCAVLNDGFRIAEEDLKLRGPGDFFGSRQHGLPTLKAADLSCDMPLLAEARDAAQQLLAGDPLLTRPEHAVLRRRVQAMFRQKDGTLN